MHTNHPKEDPLVELGYEHRDVKYGTLSKAIIGFFLFTGFCFVAGLFIYNAMHPQANRTTVQTALSTPRVKPQSPNPLLQGPIEAKADIMTLRQSEYARLHSTGPVDGEPGKVHIPVDRAMDLILERGLPKTGDAPVTTPSSTPSGTPTAPETMPQEH